MGALYNRRRQHRAEEVKTKLERLSLWWIRRMKPCARRSYGSAAKGNMLSKLLPLIPAGGRPYCEPYAGAASVFWSRDPAPVEVLNDLDDRIVNLFRVLQDREQFEELRHRIMWTPYARAEFGRALDILKTGSDDPVERAGAFCGAEPRVQRGGFHNRRLGPEIRFRAAEWQEAPTTGSCARP